MAEHKATNVVWQDGEISREDRYRILQQKGATIWFTGLSGSGKSTIAVALEKVLTEADPLVKTGYATATREETNLFTVDVLYAAALAKFDKYGYFTAEDTAKVIVDDDGRQIPLLTLHKAFDELTQYKNAEIIDKWKTPAARTKYAFNLQTMRQYILLRQAERRGLM